MAFKRGYPTRGRSGPKRVTSWVGPADQAFLSVATGAKVIISIFTLATSVPSLDRPTIVRTRGEVSVHPASAAADVSIVGAFGLAVVSTDAFAAGVASIPGPFDDADWEGWYVWRSFSFRYELLDATASLIFTRSWEVDSKAMRRLGTNTTCVAVAESQSGAFEISMPLRTLIKLA